MGRPKGSKNKSKLSQEKIDEIIKLYSEERIPLYKLQERYHIGPVKLKEILKENNITLRSFRDAKRLYPLNEDYFSEIKTKHQAYFLG